MKIIPATTFFLLASSADAFSSFKFGQSGGVGKETKSPVNTFSVEDLPGILDPVGLFDPLGLAEKATPNLLRKYREAELTHGRIAMLASVGFLVGEAVQGSTPILDGKLSGSALLQLDQLPGIWVILFFAGAFGVETSRVRSVINNPTICSKEEIGQYNLESIPGDLGFDPLGLKPEDPEEFKIKQTKELQNGRLAMIAASGFLAQELVDKKGIVEHVTSSIPDGLIPEISLPF